MIWNLVPHSPAKTAWGLWKDVRRAILAEPKRVDMGKWLATNPRQFMDRQQAPACNTVGCLAGWGAALAAPSRQIVVTIAHQWKAASYAQKFLIPYSANRDADSLFHGGGPYPFPKNANPGTRSYVRAVVRNLDRWMKTHETALRRHRLLPKKQRVL